jgi:hypothetical protein
MAKKDRASRKGNKGITVDLSGVETGSKKVIAEGEYPISVNSATLETSDKSGGQYIKFEFEVTDGKEKGQKLYHNSSLQPQALFNLKSVLAALGFEIPTKAFDLDLKELIGLECIVEVSHELYEGKKKARVTEFINPEEAEESDDSEDEDDEDEKDYSDMTLEELKEEADDQEIEYKKAIKGKKDKEAKKILIELLEEADEDEDEEEAEEEDDEDQDYDEMSLEELIAECKERGLKPGKKPKKAALVEMLEEDDEE